jgi:hypothetical protein
MAPPAVGTVSTSRGTHGRYGRTLSSLALWSGAKHNDAWIDSTALPKIRCTEAQRESAQLPYRHGHPRLAADRSRILLPAGPDQAGSKGRHSRDRSCRRCNTITLGRSNRDPFAGGRRLFVAADYPADHCDQGRLVVRRWIVAHDTPMRSRSCLKFTPTDSEEVKRCSSENGFT